MLNIRLVEVFVEHERKELFAREFGQKGRRWFASVALHLLDETSRQGIAEWFYLIVRSPEYKEKPFKKALF